MSGVKNGGITCVWHLQGVPPYAQGERFFVPRCPMCEAKAEKDPTLRTAPPPWTHVATRRKRWRELRGKRPVNWDRLHDGVRKSHVAILAPREA